MFFDKGKDQRGIPAFGKSEIHSCHAPLFCTLRSRKELYEQKKELTRIKAKITRNSSCQNIKANLRKYANSYMKSTSHYKDKKISYNDDIGNIKLSFKLINHNNGNNSNKKNLSQSIDLGDDLNSTSIFNSKLLQTNKVHINYKIKGLHNFTPEHRSISCINYRKNLNKSQSKAKMGSSNKIDKSNSNGKSQKDVKDDKDSEKENEFPGKDLFYLNRNLNRNGRLIRKDEKNTSMSCSKISSERQSLSKGKNKSNSNKFHIESYKAKIPNKNGNRKASISSVSSISSINHINNHGNENHNCNNHNNQNNSMNKSQNNINRSCNKSTNKTNKILNKSSSKSSLKQGTNTKYIIINNSKLNLGQSEKGISNSSSTSNLLVVPSSKSSFQGNFLRMESGMRATKRNSPAKRYKEQAEKTNKSMNKINPDSRSTNKKLNRSGTSSGYLMGTNRKLSCNERDDTRKELFYDSSNKYKLRESELLYGKKEKQHIKRGFIIKKNSVGNI